MSEQIENEQESERNNFDNYIIPLVTVFAVPYAALFPLFWIPFTFTQIGFPVYSLYAWPFCMLVWLLSLIVVHKYLEKQGYERFIAVSAVTCVLVQTVLIFYYSFHDL